MTNRTSDSNEFVFEFEINMTRSDRIMIATICFLSFVEKGKIREYIVICSNHFVKPIKRNKKIIWQIESIGNNGENHTCYIRFVLKF